MGCDLYKDKDKTLWLIGFELKHNLLFLLIYVIISSPYTENKTLCLMCCESHC